MYELLEQWVSINSGSDNLEGLSLMCSKLEEAFAPLQAKTEVIELPPRQVVNADGNVVDKPVGKLLRFSKQRDVPNRILLVGHMDTVFPASSAFQKPIRISNSRMQGPGAADMKGGLLIMLTALKKLELHPIAKKLSWEVLITPDEEVGSPSSKGLLMDAARKATVGLIFEPSLPGGALVSARKGSATLTIIARGRAAHVGREHHLGRNAIVALAYFIAEVHRIHDTDPGVIINFGHIHGGTAVNVVPDLAITKVNVRADHNLEKVIDTFEELAKKCGDGISLQVVRNNSRPPKPFDSRTEALFEFMRECAEELGGTLNWEPTGGVCDGNFLAAAGLPTIDTIGAIGGNIHTHDEYIELTSLETRSELVAHFLIKVASGE